MEETKKCTNKDCLQPLKPICDFYTDKNSKDGKTQWCKDCMKRQRKNYRENNREKALEQGRINSLNYYKKIKKIESKLLQIIMRIIKKKEKNIDKKLVNNITKIIKNTLKKNMMNMIKTIQPRI